MSVYDDQNKENPNIYSPDDLRQIEQQYSTSEDEKEDKAVEAGADPAELPRGAKGRDVRLEQQRREAAEEKALNDKITQNFSYTPDKKNKKGLGAAFSGAKRKRGVWFGVGGGIVGILIAFGSLFGFLNVFKLDNLMQNVEGSSFVRYLAAADGRSSKWTTAYIQIRLTEMDGDTDNNGYFRSNRVDTNSPLRDWYKTMRTSKFEADLAKKGIVFTNRADGKTRNFSVLQVDGKVVAGLDPNQNWTPDKIAAELSKTDGAIKGITDFDLDKPGANAEARRAIKKVVNENTRAWQVIKRRHIRKDIQNMTGIREWRFFETTRGKVDNVQANIRNKIIYRALPESTKSGKFLGCIFGFKDCRGTTDPADPETRATINPTTFGERNDGINTTDPDTGEPLVNDGSTEDSVREGLGGGDVNTNIQREIVSKLLSKLSGGPVALVSMVDTISRIDGNIKNQSLTKFVYMSRATQAMGLFTTYGIARDQLKTGEVTPSEVGAFMLTINNVSNSEGWEKVISGQSATTKAEGFTSAANKQAYCSEEHQAAIQLPENRAAAEKEFHYLCDSQKIGGENLAKTIEDGWNESVGVVLGPVFAAFRSGPGKIFGFFNGLLEDTIGRVLSATFTAVLKGVGLQDNFNDFIGYIVTRVASILGAGPVLSGQEPSGVFLNNILMGGAATASSSMRYQGAAKTTTESKQAAIQLVSETQKEAEKSKSLFERYFSTSSPNSIASRTLYSTANILTGDGPVTILKNIVGSIRTTLLLPFSQPANAANSPYAAEEFSGVESYDFPKECLNKSPIDATPKNSTNIQQVLGANKVSDAEITWAVLTDKFAWYDLIYSKTDDDEVAKKIYNCALLDTSVRGGLGAVYGYTNDGGLDSSAPQEEVVDEKPSPDGWIWPLQKDLRPGNCWNAQVGSLGYHAGIDINTNTTDGSNPAVAARDGEVVTASYGEFSGKYVTVRSVDGIFYSYQHLNRVDVKVGQKVKAGDPIGQVGKTGRVYAISAGHLHFVTAKTNTLGAYSSSPQATTVDPLDYLPKNAPGGYQCTK